MQASFALNGSQCLSYRYFFTSPATCDPRYLKQSTSSNGSPFSIKCIQSPLRYLEHLITLLINVGRTKPQILSGQMQISWNLLFKFEYSDIQTNILIWIFSSSNQYSHFKIFIFISNILIFIFNILIFTFNILIFTFIFNVLIFAF